MYLEITAPLGILGVTHSTLPERTRVEFERTASIPGPSSPWLLISGSGVESAVADIRNNRAIDEVLLVAETDDGCIYRLRGVEARSGFVEGVRDTAGIVLSAIAEDESWTFDIRFPNHNAASRFYTQYDDPDHPITIQKSSPSVPARSRGEMLTNEQRDALARALEAGYFEVPRETTLIELADEIGISDSAVSQRLRRGLANLLRHEVDRHRPDLRID